MKIEYSDFPNLTTNRVVLRAILNRDTAAIFSLRTNFKVNQYLGRKIHKNSIEIKTFITTINTLVAAKKAIYWVLQIKDKVKGSIGLRNYNPEDSSAEIGYELLPKHYGNGIMSEVVKEILRYAFDELNLLSIVAITHKNNSKSIQLLRKFGFQLQTKLLTEVCVNSYIFIKQKPQ